MDFTAIFRDDKKNEQFQADTASGQSNGDFRPDLRNLQFHRLWQFTLVKEKRQYLLPKTCISANG